VSSREITERRVWDSNPRGSSRLLAIFKTSHVIVLTCTDALLRGNLGAYLARPGGHQIIGLDRSGRRRRTASHCHHAGTRSDKTTMPYRLWAAPWCPRLGSPHAHIRLSGVHDRCAGAKVLACRAPLVVQGEPGRGGHLAGQVRVDHATETVGMAQEATTGVSAPWRLEIGTVKQRTGGPPPTNSQPGKN
jgi:hypothetical protein